MLAEESALKRRVEPVLCADKKAHVRNAALCFVPSIMAPLRLLRAVRMDGWLKVQVHVFAGDVYWLCKATVTLCSKLKRRVSVAGRL